MVEKKEASNERVYTIPLRRKTIKIAKYKRSPKAMRVIREFLQRHMKSDDIKIDKKVNEYIWNQGIKHPPSKVKVKAIKNEAGQVKVTLEEDKK